MKFKFLLCLQLLIFSSYATASYSNISVSYDKTGRILRAEGMNFSRGDTFNPGMGIIDLNQLQKRLIKSGYNAYGQWALLHYQEYGWVYKINAFSKEGDYFYLINAFSGNIIGTMTKVAPQKLEKQLAKD